jgi:predicted flap endonuclease-1-like 5' DNA nuclease
MFRKRSILIGLLVVSLALTAFSPSPAAEQQDGIPWWIWVVVILILLALLLWWLLGSRSGEQAAPTREAGAATAPCATEAPTPTPTPAPAPAPSVPDDLTRIEGIGPKISSLLQEAGITTFAQLAQADLSRLEQIVRDVGITIADPTTWPEQAGLAAGGEWGALEVLQDELKGGRRV